MNQSWLEKREAVRLELLETEEEFAEVARAYHADGIFIPNGTRATLQAKIARLKVEIHKLNMKVHAEKKEAQAVNKKQMLSLLVARLESEGLGKYVNEAQSESRIMLADAGFLDAFQSRS